MRIWLKLIISILLLTNSANAGTIKVKIIDHHTGKLFKNKNIVSKRIVKKNNIYLIKLPFCNQ